MILLLIYFSKIFAVSDSTIYCGNPRSGTCIADNYNDLSNAGSLAACAHLCSEDLSSAGCCNFNSDTGACRIGIGAQWAELKLTDAFDVLMACDTIDDLCIENADAEGCSQLEYLVDMDLEQCYHDQNCNEDATCLGIQYLESGACSKITDCNWEDAWQPNPTDNFSYRIKSKRCFQDDIEEYSYVEKFAAGTSACVGRIDLPCDPGASTGCSASWCAHLCFENSDCAFFFHNTGGRCSLHDSCTNTRDDVTHHGITYEIMRSSGMDRVELPGHGLYVDSVTITTNAGPIEWDVQDISVDANGYVDLDVRVRADAVTSADVYIGIVGETLECVEYSSNSEMISHTLRIPAEAGTYDIVARSETPNGCGSTFVTGTKLHDIRAATFGSDKFDEDLVPIYLYAWVPPSISAFFRWYVKDVNGFTKESGLSMENEENDYDPFSLKTDSIFTFEITNEGFGYGLCCTVTDFSSDAPGYYTLAWGHDENIFHMGGEFTTSETYLFTTTFYDWGPDFSWFQESKIKIFDSTASVLWPVMSEENRGEIAWPGTTIDVQSENGANFNPGDHWVWTLQSTGTLMNKLGGTCLHYDSSVTSGNAISMQQCSSSTFWCTESTQDENQRWITRFKILDPADFTDNRCLAWSTSEDNLVVRQCDDNDSEQEFEIKESAGDPHPTDNCPNGCEDVVCGENSYCEAGVCICTPGSERETANGPCIGTNAPTSFPTMFPTKEPSLAPTQSPTDSPTESPTKVPTESPTPLGAIDTGNGDSAGATTDNSNPSSGAANTSSAGSDSFTNSAGFLVIVILLIFAIVAIIGFAYFFKYKNNKLITQAQTKTPYDPVTDGVLNVAPEGDVDEGMGMDSGDLINIAEIDTKGATDPGFDDIEEPGMTDPGFIEQINPLGPPGEGTSATKSNGETVRRPTVGLGEGAAADGDIETIGASSRRPHYGSESETLGLYDPNRTEGPVASGGPGQSEGSVASGAPASQRKHIKDTQTMSSASAIEDDLYGGDGLPATGSPANAAHKLFMPSNHRSDRRGPERSSNAEASRDGTLTHPGYIKSDEPKEGGNMTHPGYLGPGEGDDSSSAVLGDGPGDGNLTHPGYLEKEPARDGNLTHPGYIADEPGPGGDGSLTHPGYVGSEPSRPGAASKPPKNILPQKDDILPKKNDNVEFGVDFGEEGPGSADSEFEKNVSTTKALEDLDEPNLPLQLDDFDDLDDRNEFNAYGSNFDLYGSNSAIE